MRELSIAVIGASVRGTVLVERLVASAPELAPDSVVTIHVIDPHPPGSGRIWRAGQPQELVMNTVAAQSTLFGDVTLTCEGPVVPGPSLAQWCEQVSADPQVAATLPDDVAAEAARTVGWSNPSRLLYGHYLRWCWERVVGSAPPEISIRHVSQLANDVTVADDGGFDVALADGSRLAADAVLLALGWLEREPAPGQPPPADAWVPAGNPIDQAVERLAAGATVAVRGVGMSLFDILSLVTEVRGGRFTPVGYRASGGEPILLVGSRRGVPYLAKPDFGAPPFFPAQRWLRATIPALLAERRTRQLDFHADVWPLIVKDAHHDHLTASARLDPGSLTADLDRTLERLAPLVPGTPEWDDFLATAYTDAHDALDLAAVETPLRDAYDSADDLDAHIAEILRADAEEAAKGIGSPLKLALHSVQGARGAVIDLVADGGLTPDSFRGAYQRFLAFAAYLGSGPPLFRSRQLLAAHDAGLVRFLGPGIHVESGPDGLRVRGRLAPEPVAVDAVVDARLDAPSVVASADPLIRALLARGQARVWRHSDGTPSDALDVDLADGTLRDADGERVPGLIAVGVPLEDLRVFTIIAPVPGTNSSVLRELDAAARAALVAAHRRHQPSESDLLRSVP